MELSSLKILLSVAKLGSFAEAARQWDKDPSNISRIIASLEKNLQVALFKRSTRTLTLTEAGRHYVAAIEPLVNDLDLAANQVRQQLSRPTGRLTLTASNAFAEACLLPLLPDFCEAYPEIKLDLRLTDANVDLLAENVDLACRLTPAFESDLIGVKLFTTRYLLCASPAYLAKVDGIESTSQIADLHYIAMNLPHYRNRLVVKGSGTQHTIKLNPYLRVSGALGLKQCLLQDMGCGLVADWLVSKEIRQGKLINLFPDIEVTATDFSTAAWLLYPSRDFLPAKTRAMIDFLKTRVC